MITDEDGAIGSVLFLWCDGTRDPSHPPRSSVYSTAFMMAARIGTRLI
jgi:hypothetical protein